MPSKECLFVMEQIDNNGISVHDARIREHLEKCADCRSYYEVSSRLKSLEQVEEVELWNEFLERQEGRVRGLSWLRPMIAAASLIVAAGLIFTFGGIGTVFTGKQTDSLASNIVKSEAVSAPVSGADYNYDTSDLDYYYEISMGI